ncbi:hypothetical protein CHGG_07563 [Chaetomium globosum CBS 148.51]|uniref:ATP-dependent DNA helicase n=1 Tax=Chaetomium globosum (strain ATCC 6205 / CBS 148.51 / DSM 1962 / NBRC 6347 / NRRL 1970) TaxID=306901 RepID=Q2GWU1_CHAGB|nr:uncharacterized protein CHGG_07563 [Chaetomium globosum CBS 148.51]EAQ86310.1 hypothetical protein CHGG_07563 [Chaetomium globosum CBS 148.51]
MREIVGNKRLSDVSDEVAAPPKRKNLTHAVMSERYHAGGVVEGDSVTVAAARQELARIQRDHRSLRRNDEEPSQTPRLSELLRRQSKGREDVEGDDQSSDDDRSNSRSEPGIAVAEGPVPEEPIEQRGKRGRPRKQPPSDPTLRRPPGRPRIHPLHNPAAPRRPRGRPRRVTRPEPSPAPLRSQIRHGRPPKPRQPVGRPRKIPVNDPPPVPPRDFNEPPPKYTGDLQGSPLCKNDVTIKHEFNERLAQENMRLCFRCKERWFDVELKADGVCKRCHQKDDKKRADEPFLYSAENHLDFGEMPDSLPILHPAEEMVISRVHVAVNVFTVRGQQYKYRGHVVHFLRDVGKVYDELPLLPKDLDIVILRPSGSEADPAMDRQFRKRFRIRRRVVATWLRFLSRNHPGYKGFLLSESNLSQLPEDESIFDQLTIHEVSSWEDLEPDQGPVDGDRPENEDGLGFDEAAVPNVLVKDSEFALLQGGLENNGPENQERPPMQQQQPRDAHHLPMPPIRFTPISEFNRSQALLSLACPSLYPRGLADFNQPRQRAISYSDYLAHAMKWHDGRFARHHTFRYIALNTLMRQQAYGHSRFYVNKQRSTVLTKAELQQALENPDRPEAQAILNQISRFAGAIQGTRPYWYRRRRECESFAHCLGVPGVFITLSPADLHWHDLYRHMPEFERWQCRYEWQGRGSSHNHGLYWFEEGPQQATSTDEERARFARLWGYHISAENPQPHRIGQGGDGGNPLNVDALQTEVTWDWLDRVLNRCQRHHCSSTYCLRINKRAAELAEKNGEPGPEPECRFLFPRPHREEAGLVRRPGKTWWSFEAVRNDSHMNQYNRLITLCWLRNTDISPCTGIEAVINYAAKYCSKTETKTSTYAEIAGAILPHVSDRNPMLSFVSRMMNKLIGERDYSAQETCHILLKLPLYQDSRVVISVDCRPADRHNRLAEFSEADEAVQTKKTSYEKYLERPSDMEAVSYFRFLETWNFQSPNPGNWREWRPPARPRVLYYFPRYTPVHGHVQFEDFCRVKLMLAHPHRECGGFLTLDGTRFSGYVAAYEHCLEHHEHEDDHYGEAEAPEPAADEDEFRAVPFQEDISLEDWQELARMVPELQPEHEEIDLLTRRDIDIRYDWHPHVGRYIDERFDSGKYWDLLKVEHPSMAGDVEHIPLKARDTLNREQRIVYDTIMGHLERDNVPPILLHVDGGGGTGKSYMVNMLSSHLQQTLPGRKSPILRAAPTGVASNQINGQTLHSLLRLPIDGNYRPLTETPTVLGNLQRVFAGVRYLVIDEKSMLGLKTLGWIDRRLREIFPEKNDFFFGGLSVILIGDFFQLPPVLNKPIYAEYDRLMKEMEVAGLNAYRAFEHSVFLETIQRQHGADQAGFRDALVELRQARVSVTGWELLVSRCASNLSPRVQAGFANAVRIYPTREKVRSYNHDHMVDLNSPALYVEATHQGDGASKAESKDAGNLSSRFPVCIGARVMLTRNIWNPVGLVNGAQGTVHDIGWAEGADPLRDPPLVIMVALDKYTGPPYYTRDVELQDGQGRLVVPILQVRQDFTLKNKTCSRTQFPLVVAYAITVHKSQGITLPKVVCDISEREFASGLSYVAVSRASRLDGVMFDVPFDRSRVNRDPPTAAMQRKLADYERRWKARLLEPLYRPSNVEASDTESYV